MQRTRPQDDIALLPAAVYDPTEVDSRRAASDSNALQALARVATHHRQVGTDSGTYLLIPASPSPRKRPRLSVIGDKDSPADEWEDDFVGAKDSKRHGGPRTFSRSDHCERGKGKDRATFDHAELVSTEPVRQNGQSKLLKGLDKIHKVKSHSEGRRRETTRSSSFALFDRRAAGVASTFQKVDGVDRPEMQPKWRKGKEPVDPLAELRGKGGKIARFCSAQHHLRKATANTLAAPKTTRSETHARPDGPTDVAGHDKKDEADDLDVIGAPNNPTKRTRDGKVIEHLQLGPLAHPPVPGDPEYATIEPYSKIRLRLALRELSPGSRCIPHEDLQHHFSDRYHLSPSLLYSCARHQRGTDEVDVELDADFIVVGVLAWKGPVKVTNPNAKEGTKERKNLRFTLVDLSTPEASSSGHGLLNVILFEAYSVDNRIEADGYQVPVYQGGSGGAYEKFWKESVGAVVAILNPRILKPRQDPGKSNVYTLVPQNAESMMIIGRAQDLSSCKARKANGSSCDEWCDGRVNKYCQYHVHRAVKSTGVRRPETANVNSSLSTTSTFNPSEFERQFVPSAKTRAARFAIKDEYDPMRKIGLLPRDNTSLNDGLKTYVTRSRSSKQFVDNNPGRIKAVIASELRHAAITSGNGSGGYVQGIRDGPTLADLEKSRASKRKEQQTAERELKVLLQHDQGKTLGGQYLARRTVPAEASLNANGQVDNSTVEPKPKKSTSKSLGEEAFGPPAAPAERRAFSTHAVHLIGYDPTKAGDEDEGVGDASRGEKARQLEKIMALPRGRKRFKAGRSGKKAVAPKAVPPRPSHSRSPSRSLESDSDLSIEGGPQK
ncbi:BZ3500_MvSof-1268-A1-R1_Chr12-2g03938 [Microbotryum saponariae]|uniref:BZ3500_MvSof-1268-A1-R1_Chr12-2g03938 protein n=1 Tax=Microbotryum saponariae TaxID=289078 RepID=A0A2X0KS93_9BASI|nr:BZ3500_MvSof-1268-A1-R1_Chr12-2g03938 [Microbotryum saponariae]